MPIGATLGAAGIGAATSIASSNAQSSAARNAAQTATDNTAANNALQREIYYDQRGLYQPFYQSDLARRSALDEMFGINAINQQPSTAGATGAYTPGGYGGAVGAGGAGGMGGNGGSGLRAYSPALSLPQGINGQAGGAANDGNDAAMRGYMMRGNLASLDGNNRGTAMLPPGVQNALLAQQNKGTAQVQDTTGVTDPNAVATTGGTQGLFDSALPGADRFNNSMFNPLAQTMFNTDRDRIDSNLAASGMLYDGVRQTAVQEAGNRSAQNALSMYMNGLMGAPTSQAAGGISNAAGNYGMNVQANNTAGANALMQSQQMQGQAQADMWGGIGSAAGFGLGAFNWGGK